MASMPSPSFTVKDAVTLPFPHLSGAVDVIVVKQKDGSLSSSPFYVRFGKFQGLLKRKEKQVHITVNGTTMPFTMRLGRTGVAYFSPSPSQKEKAKRCEGNGVVIEASSQTGYSSGEDNPFGSPRDSMRDLNLKFAKEADGANNGSSGDIRYEGNGERDLGEEEIASTGARSSSYNSLASADSSSGSTAESAKQVAGEGPDNRPESSGRAEEISSGGKASGKTQLNGRGGAEIGSSLSTEGSSMSDSISITELAGGMDALDLSTMASRDDLTSWSEEAAVELRAIIKVSGLAVFRGMELSRCLNLLQNTDTSGAEANEDDCPLSVFAAMSMFKRNLISREEYEQQTARVMQMAALSSPSSPLDATTASADNSTVCRVGNVLIPLSDVLRVMVQYLTYHEYPDDCPSRVMLLQPNQLVDVKWDPSKQAAEGWRFFSWLSSSFRSPSSSTRISPADPVAIGSTATSTGTDRRLERDSMTPIGIKMAAEVPTPPASTSVSAAASEAEVPVLFCPSKEQISMLDLREGQNTITYSCHSSLWGTQTASAYLYLMPWNSKLVVSDVDGTITKSDVLGHVMTAMGRDWSHSGVTKLFEDIGSNGYHLLYLSARSIGQASLTRDFLFKLTQDGGHKLPSGPVMISPDGILPSLFREMILKRPHEFKIACLQTIRNLFPPDWNPFFAGFGNRPTDEVSYEAVGVPPSRIFTINPKGEVTMNNCSNCKQATWCTLSGINELVHQFFPQYKGQDLEGFSGYSFWKVGNTIIEDDEEP
mmetsp:Transcript_11396/g.28918  ORF Transcript_11396/g.28918 Transcript_11396/m.28918 type:complete len:766 (+) Transcript_11396:371-2668(+)